MSESPAPTFASLGLDQGILTTLAGLGYEAPTPVQAAAIPALLKGGDVLGLAATGTGKTAAFALPMVQRLKAQGPSDGKPRALVVVPTRELAMQVATALTTYSQGQGIRVVPVYGGQEIIRQMRVLARGVDVVVATPGRAIDHLERKTLILSQVSMVVLDEADEMLDMGFAEDLETLLDALPEKRQTALFSATLAPRIAQIAERHLDNPTRVKIATQVKLGTAPKITQVAYVVPRGGKDAAMVRLVDIEAPTSAIVFCRTRIEVERLSDLLLQRGLAAVALHGGMSQEQRDAVLRRFKGKEGTSKLLIATDVAARGLDVPELSHVFNYDVPTSAEVYVHRIGRTGRAGREGRALTLLDPKERRLQAGLERAANSRIAVEPLPGADQVLAKTLERTTARLVARLSGRVAEPIKEAITVLLENHDARAVAEATLAELQQVLFPPRADDEIVDRPVARFGERPQRESRGGDRPQRTSRDGERPPRERSIGADTRVVFSIGKQVGVRPQDLVGAIANEAQIPSREIGVIEVGERESKVELTAQHARTVMAALRNSTIRGRRFRLTLERADTDVRSPAPRPSRSAKPRPPPPPPPSKSASDDDGEAPPKPRPSRKAVAESEIPEPKPSRKARPSADRGPGLKASGGRREPSRFVSRAESSPAPSEEDEGLFGARSSASVTRVNTAGGLSKRDKPSFGGKPSFGAKRSFGDKPAYGDRPSYGGKRSFGDKPSFADKPSSGGKRAFGDKPSFGRKPSFGGKPKTGGWNDGLSPGKKRR